MLRFYLENARTSRQVKATIGEVILWTQAVQGEADGGSIR
jgi:hypothetical protein